MILSRINIVFNWSADVIQIGPNWPASPPAETSLFVSRCGVPSRRWRHGLRFSPTLCHIVITSVLPQNMSVSAVITAPVPMFEDGNSVCAADPLASRNLAIFAHCVAHGLSCGFEYHDGPSPLTNTELEHFATAALLLKERLLNLIMDALQPFFCARGAIAKMPFLPLLEAATKVYAPDPWPERSPPSPSRQPFATMQQWLARSHPPRYWRPIAPSISAQVLDR
jgi:hypothetical protein